MRVSEIRVKQICVNQGLGVRPTSHKSWTVSVVALLKQASEDLHKTCLYLISLIGVQADQLVLRGLIASHLPALDTLLQVCIQYN